MKRTGVKVFAVIAAGMLATAGAFGVVTSACVKGTENVETVEYKAERNDSSLTFFHDNAIPSTTGETGYSEIWEIVENSTHAQYSDGFWLGHSKGFDGVVLVSRQHYDNSNELSGGQYWIFTRKNGEKMVWCAGFIDTNLPIKYKDGVIYACNTNNEYTQEAFETYLISPDGKEIVHKDYVDSDLWGYTNDSNIESNSWIRQ